MSRTFTPTIAPILGACLCLFSGALKAQHENRAWKLESLASSSAWSPENPDNARVLDWSSALGLELKLETGSVIRVLAKEPTPLPQQADSLIFTLGSGDWSGDPSFRFRLLATDSRGAEYAYKAVSGTVQTKENYFYPAQQATWSPLRLTIPGLKRPVPGSGVDERNYNIEVRKRPAQGPDTPQPPLTLRGLEFIGIRPGATKLYLKDFMCGQVTPKTSRLHYLINSNECFGEIDGPPSLSLGYFGPAYGESYRLVWTIRDHYEGRPFLAGEKTLTTSANAPDRILTLAERIVFPVEEQGVYWIKVRRIWNDKAGSPIPDRLDTYDVRLDVLDGKPAVTRTPLAGEIPGMAVDIRPDRNSFVIEAGAPRKITVTFSSITHLASPSYRVTAVSAGTGATLRTWESPLGPTAPQNISIDLADLPAGAIRLHAELLSAGHRMDKAEQLVGLRPAHDAEQTAPDPSADWHKLTKGQSLIYVGMSKGQLKEPATRIAKVKELLDEAGAVSHLVEYEFKWADVEPMPGVFDWSEVDAVVAYAKQKGQSVLLWPTFVGGEPNWIPPFFQKLADGSVSGTRSYLFQGGRINYWHARDLQENILRLCRAMALRYRGEPGVHGYYLIVEHGGDNPWFNFFPGHEPETKSDYTSYLDKRYKTLDSLGTAWGRSLAGWDSVAVPSPEASDRERLDWNQFRSARLGEFFVKAVREIRAIDPYKLMMIYTGAADGDSATEFATLGCMLADGGAASPVNGGATTMGYAAAGLGRRTEEISVTQWAAQFPTQLDATLFNLTLGGGRNANAKMFFTPGKPLSELRRDPRVALDRFEKFIPIWRELAPTEALPWEAFTLKDVAGGMLASKSTTGLTDVYANMVPFDAHVLAPAVPMSMAKRGKLVFLQPRIASHETVVHDELAAYVKSGGTLILCANSARFSPDQPGEDWVLLKRLGIAPPSGDLLRTGPVSASPVAGAGLAAGAGSFMLRDAWRASESGALVLAVFDATGTPAITRHHIGQGTVDLIWANSITPATEGGGYPFFRDLADAAGVARHSDSSAPSLWTNLLRNPQTGDHYGTVYHAAWSKTTGPATSGFTRWKVPPGDYAVTELISGRNLGVKSSEGLLATGMETTLGPREVAVYRFQKH